MTIMGSFEAGINGNNSIVYAKSALNFVSSMMFAADNLPPTESEKRR